MSAIDFLHSHRFVFFVPLSGNFVKITFSEIVCQHVLFFLSVLSLILKKSFNSAKTLQNRALWNLCVFVDKREEATQKI